MTAAADAVPSVSAVIPTQGTRPEVLEATIDRLAAEPCVTQIVLVGNAMIGRPMSGGPGVPVSVMDAPAGGPNAARQAGLDAATEEVVLFLDDDVLPEPGLAAGHAAHHARAAGLVVVGYMPVARDSTGRYATATAQLYALEYERRVKSYEQDPGAILRNLWGGNVSLRRADALRVGVGNVAYPGRRHEDQDFGLRCAACGLSGLFDRGLLAGHHYRRTRRAFLRDAWAQGYERTVLRHNEAGTEWFARGTGHGGTARRAAPGLRSTVRSAELASLRIARRLQLYRGSASARRDTNRQEGHQWQRRS